MRLRLIRKVAFGAVTVAVGFGNLAAPAAEAQQPETVVAVDAELRDVGAAYYGGFVEVEAGGEYCGRLSFTDAGQRTADDDAELVLGTEGTPEACSREGAEITLQDGRGIPLANTYTLEPGARIQLDWFVIGPVREEVAEPRPTEDGRTSLWIDPVLAAGAERFPYFDVFADGEHCGRLSLTDEGQRTPDGGVELMLGQPGQPEACGRDGAVLSLVNANGIRLAQVYRLEPGHQIPVYHFTIPPPGTGPDARLRPMPARAPRERPVAGWVR